MKMREALWSAGSLLLLSLRPACWPSRSTAAFEAAASKLAGSMRQQAPNSRTPAARNSRVLSGRAAYGSEKNLLLLAFTGKSRFLVAPLPRKTLVSPLE